VPRKLRIAKSRNHDWTLDLGYLDVITLKSGYIRPDMPDSTAHIRSLEDAKEAWRAHRDELLEMCQCHKTILACPGHNVKHKPGERPWAWWYFDQGYECHPEDEAAELRRLDVMDAEEIKVLGRSQV